MGGEGTDGDGEGTVQDVMREAAKCVTPTWSSLEVLRTGQTVSILYTYRRFSKSF